MVANAVPGRDFGKKLCEIFGLDPKQTGRISLHFEMDNLLTLEVVHLVTNEEAPDIIAEIRKFRFVEIEAEEK